MAIAEISTILNSNHHHESSSSSSGLGVSFNEEYEKKANSEHSYLHYGYSAIEAKKLNQRNIRQNPGQSIVGQGILPFVAQQPSAPPEEDEVLFDDRIISGVPSSSLARVSSQPPRYESSSYNGFPPASVPSSSSIARVSSQLPPRYESSIDNTLPPASVPSSSYLTGASAKLPNYDESLILRTGSAKAQPSAPSYMEVLAEEIDENQEVEV